ncbi:hypothetical protein Tco_0116560 [Tanacetum coccineum]
MVLKKEGLARVLRVLELNVTRSHIHERACPETASEFRSHCGQLNKIIKNGLNYRLSAPNNMKKQNRSGGKYVRSGCTTALNVVPWETDDESCLSSASTLFVANHAEKPEKFNGQNFKRWQQKMFFHLGTLNLAWFLNETTPQLRMERLNLGNSPTANIKGKGDVIHIWKREIGRSSGIDDEVVQNQRQHDDNDL